MDRDKEISDGLPLQTDHQQHHAQMQQMAPRTTQFGVSWSPSSVNSTASMTSSVSSASSPSYPGGVGQQTVGEIVLVFSVGKEIRKL